MHPHDSTVDPQDRARILAQATAALPERTSSTVRAGLAWARVSKGVQDTIEDQLTEIQRLGKVLGVPIERERYATGSRWNHHSAEWAALLTDIESGHYSHLLLFKADRLATDDHEMIALVRRALLRGMQVHDTVVGPIGDHNVALLGMMSHHDITATSQRTILKLDSLPGRGIKVGGIPYGYAPQCLLHPCKCGLHGKHVPHPQHSRHVLALFAGVASGAPLDLARRRFNAASGLRCDLYSIKRILRNPYYAGFIVGRKVRDSKVLGRYGRPKEEWDVGTHDQPIIDKRTYDQVQARLDSQAHGGQKRARSPRDPLVGLLFYDCCGRRAHYHRASATSQSWQCPLCQASRGTKKVQRAIELVLAAIPFPSEQAAAHYGEGAQSQLRLLEAQIQAFDAQLDRMARRRSVWMDQVADGDLSREDFRSKMAESDQERRICREQRELLAARLESAPGYADVAREVLAGLARKGNWTGVFADASPDQRRTLYATLISRVAIDPAAGTMRVDYTAALAGWCGRASDTVLLPSQRGASQPKG